MTYKEKITACSSEEIIANKLFLHLESHTELCIENYYYKSFQIDFAVISNYGYFIEYEIKTNLKDIKKDCAKVRKHIAINNGKYINKFVYVIPDHLVSESKRILLKQYGILSYDKNFNFIHVRDSKVFHKIIVEKIIILDILLKSYKKYKKLRKEINNV